MTTPRKAKSAAIVTIHSADEMTKRGRKAIAAWLRRQAAMLEASGHVYASRFTGRYLYK
jgi:hypothetical protein